MPAPSFLPVYDQLYAPRLGVRQKSFRRIFELLETKPEKEYFILETGCARQENNWSGDGLSTVLWDHFVRTHAGSVLSVDIDQNNCNIARKFVSDRTKVFCMDSVKFLWHFLPPRKIDLLYLDSFDLDVRDPHPSSMHHLQELTAIVRHLEPGSLVVVDDNPTSGPGKGQYIADFMRQLGIPPAITDYQMAWII